MQDIAIIHLAKKNLCHELEYIQTVCQSLNIRVSTKFGEFNSKLMLVDDPLAALSSQTPKGVKF